MANIEPLRKDINHPGEIKKHNISVRLWHWLNLLVITGSLLTVLLNSTLFDVKSNTGYVQQQLQESGISVTTTQAKSVAHGLEDKVWAIHIYFGYALATLFLFRLIAEFFQPGRQRFFSGLKDAYRTYRIRSKNSTLALHDLTVKSLYLFFYLLLTIMALTGLSMAFDQELGISNATSHSIKDFHGFCMYLILAFIAIHIIGVLLAERKESKGIVSDMINGGKV
ncbi:cytochrome b/b6 domain-containing protein [Pedobacter gandavensis]|uniref:Cytochrome b/b6 domain-containing protein n=1 Tax=Pedobacter gandavensis TaxID=2679963 RepID=A0ABR6ESG2_9SPHI|nr:cytochrome b/b6 domain-containing protein [Pedobacter gandavensis]MBB2148200.1 cytochrome b/b6 domain-containing protein [Pedobacter gandavensis]